MMKQSEKDISKRLDVSVSKIDRKLTEISSHTVLRHSTLPKSMNWDEFKATKYTKGKMAFSYIKFDYFIARIFLIKGIIKE